MGKGTIQSHIGGGQYSVTLNFDNSGIDDRISRLQTVISELDPRISARLADEQAAESEMDSAWQDLQAAITVLEGIDPQKNPEAWQAQADTVTSLHGVYNDTYLVWGQAEAARRELEAARTSKLQRITLLESYRLADQTVYAWCADYTMDLSGEVGTVEIPGERQHVQIRPGYNGAAAYDPARDGAIAPIEANTPAGTFYNLAMMPGWQKWRPRYRRGIAFNVDGVNDICDVDLLSESSSIKDLDVNQGSILHDVPIEYMNCNADAIDSGEEVLVEFPNREWDAPKVIGFLEQPDECIPDLPPGESSKVWRLSWGQDRELYEPGPQLHVWLWPYDWDGSLVYYPGFNSVLNETVYDMPGYVPHYYPVRPSDHKIPRQSSLESCYDRTVRFIAGQDYILADIVGAGFWQDHQPPRYQSFDGKYYEFDHWTVVELFHNRQYILLIYGPPN